MARIFQNLTFFAVAALLSACATAPESTTLSDAGMTYTEKGWTFSDVENKDWVQAEEVLTKEVAANPEDPFRLLNLAYVYTQTDRSNDAVAMYERVLTLETNPVATLSSGQDASTKKIARDALVSLSSAR